MLTLLSLRRGSTFRLALALFSFLVSRLVLRGADIYIDATYTNPNADGSSARPYPTIGQGFAVAGNGDRLRIRVGLYGLDQPLLGKSVSFFSENGRVVIQPARFIVNAGEDQVISMGGSATFRAVATAINVPAPTVWHWEKIRGPGSALSDDFNSPTFSFQVTSSGEYEFQVTASNGHRSTADRVKATFLEPVLTVDAGRRQRNVPFPWIASLAGRILVDDRVNAEASAQWSKSYGPGAAYFSNPTAVGTSVTVSQPGGYSFRLKGSYRGQEVDAYVGVSFNPRTGAITLGTTPLPGPSIGIERGSGSAIRLVTSKSTGIIESSDDLVNWSDSGMVALDGLIEANINAQRKFYRLRVPSQEIRPVE
ncbi:MAG: hypothetical protein L0Z50_16950 [Verrucomicrobiales bacterium]|nr:hypothetical protein [Verrucomicrobiales bacterium]